MSKPTLYRIGPHHGVIALMTEDAYKMYGEAQEYGVKYGSQDQRATSAWKRVAAGTMTFVRPGQFGAAEEYLLHTGDYSTIDFLQKKCKIVSVDSGSVPLSSGDADMSRRELEMGYGPKPELLQAIIELAGGELKPLTGTVG